MFKPQWEYIVDEFNQYDASPVAKISLLVLFIYFLQTHLEPVFYICRCDSNILISEIFQTQH